MINRKSILIALLSVLSIYVISQDKTDSLERKLEYIKGEERLDVLVSLSNNLWVNPPEKTIKFAEEAIELAQRLNDLDAELYARNNAGIAYNISKNKEKALEHLFRVIEISDSVDNKNLLSIALNNVGIIYSEMQQIDKAVDCWRQASEIMLDIGDTLGYINSRINIGSNYINKNELDSAYQVFIDAENITKKMGDKTTLHSIYTNQSEILLRWGENKKALDKVLLALDEDIANDNKYNLSNDYLSISGIYFILNNTQKGLFYLKKAETIALEYEYLDLLEAVYYEYYNNLKNFNSKEALKYLEKYLEIHESNISRELQNKVSEMEVNYDLQKKEKEITRLNNEQLKNDLELSKTENSRRFFMGLVLLLFIISGFSINRYYYRRKKTKQLEESNKKIQASKDRLNEMIDQRNKLFSIIAHDLRSPFNAFMGYADLLLDDYEHLSEEQRQQFIKEINSSGKNLYNLLENLLHWAKTQNKDVRLQRTELDLVDIIEESIELFHHFSKKKNIKIDYFGPESLETRTDRNFVYTVLRNLVSNAIKYTDSGKSIQIRLEEDKQYYSISVVDEGQGISEEKKNAMFKYKINASTPGTNNEPGTGLGLPLSYEMASLLGGKLSHKNAENGGSIFIFTIPKENI